MYMNKALKFLSVLILTVNINLTAQTQVACDNKNISIEGSNYITVKNDEGVSVETLKNRHKNVLSTTRETHKDTKIYCIVSSATKMKLSKKSNLPIQPFITGIIEVIKERQQQGDTNIYIIEGHKFTTIEDLKDNVHLSIAGAKSLAEKLSNIIE